MSDFDVNDTDMAPRSLTPQDVELVLGREVPEQDNLARFASVLNSLHHTRATIPTDEAVAAFSTRAAEIVRANRIHSFGTQAPTKPPTQAILRKRLVGAVGATVLLTGMTGVAVAADAAAPGDPLYGLDRAMESVGVGDGGSPERLAEAQSLVEGGQLTAAIAHAARAVDANSGTDKQGFSPEAAEAVEALRSAAERADLADGEGDDPKVNDSIAGILNQIAAMLDSGELQPSEIGARISELAREIGRGGPDENANSSTEPDPGNESPGPPAETPVGPPDDAPAGASAGSPSGPPEDVPGAGAGRP